jgi:hypothetical protein
MFVSFLTTDYAGCLTTDGWAVLCLNKIRQWGGASVATLPLAQTAGVMQVRAALSEVSSGCLLPLGGSKPTQLSTMIWSKRPPIDSRLRRLSLHC